MVAKLMKQQNKYLSIFQKPITKISALLIKQSQFSLRWILLSRILLVIILFFLASQFITYQTVRSTLVETARQNLTESASRKTETLENSIAAIKSNLAIASQDYILKSGDSLNYQTFIDELPERLATRVDCVQLINIITNEVAASNCGTRPIQTFFTDLWPQQERQLKINNLVKTSYLLPDLASPNNTSANESQISLLFSVPVYAIAPETSKFQLRYVLSVSWKLPLEQNTVSTIVIDEAGTILAHPNGDKVGRNLREYRDTSQLEAIIKNALAEDYENVIRVRINNQLLIGYAAIANPISTDNNNRLVILAVAPLGETLPGIKEIKEVLLSAIACLIAISIMVSIYLTSTLANPLDKLIDYAIDVNDVDAVRQHKSPEKLKVREFNKLAETLQKIEGKLKSLGKELDTTLKHIAVFGDSKNKVLAPTYEKLRTNLNGIIGSLQLILDNYCDDREEEIEYLQQCFDCSIKLLGVLEEFFNVLQEEKAVL